VESAVRTYFGRQRGLDAAPTDGAGTDTQQAKAYTSQYQAGEASPAEAALLAGMIASPSGYDPVQNPRRARERRNLVLKDMLQQHMVTRAEYRSAVLSALPSAEQVSPPRPDSSQPYFSTWLTQQLVDRYRAGRVFSGGLTVKTTIDPELQAAGEQAINGRLEGIGPSASLVA